MAMQQTWQSQRQSRRPRPQGRPMQCGRSSRSLLLKRNLISPDILHQTVTFVGCLPANWKSTDANRWDEKAGLRRDAVRSQVIDVLEAQEIKETGNEED